MSGFRDPCGDETLHCLDFGCGQTHISDKIVQNETYIGL